MTKLVSNDFADYSGGTAELAARGAAAVLGAFAMLNLAEGYISPGFDANIWWIDLRWLGQKVAFAVMLAGAISMLCFALLPQRRLWPDAWAHLPVAVLLFFAIVNSAGFYVLLAGGLVRSSTPVPLSLAVVAALWFILHAMRSCGRVTLGVRRVRADRRPRWLLRRAILCAAVAVVLVAASLGQMYCFGKTDYRRDADAIVVFGAGVYSNGAVSDALADRMRTAIDLHARGYADKLILSGGPGQGKVHETTAMREMAIRNGVPPGDIMLDPHGVNTGATVVGTSKIFDDIGATRVLAVSHFYHLPRIKLAYQRRGREVYTVPATESYTLRAMPYYVAREVVAMWVYYLHPGRC